MASDLLDPRESRLHLDLAGWRETCSLDLDPLPLVAASAQPHEDPVTATDRERKKTSPLEFLLGLLPAAT